MRRFVLGPPMQNSVVSPTPRRSESLTRTSADAPHSRSSVATSTTAATSLRWTLIECDDAACRDTPTVQIDPP